MILEKMDALSTKEINVYIQNTQTRCSYKYIVLRSLIFFQDKNNQVAESRLLKAFEMFFHLRTRMGLLVENRDNCNPLKSSSIKKVLSTPLQIFERDNVVKRIEVNGESLVHINFNSDSSTVSVLNHQITTYFAHECLDKPDHIEELLKVWECHLHDDFSQTKIQSHYEKVFLHLYDHTFQFLKPSKDFEAEMTITYTPESGPMFLVLEGSQVDEIEGPDSTLNFNEHPSTATLAELRKDLKRQGLLVQKEGCWILTQDYPFPSPSSASQFVAGTTSNGKTDWKKSDGFRLKDILEMNSQIPAKFRYLSKFLTNTGYGALITFFIDKWAGMTPVHTPSENPVNYQYFLDFYQSFSLPFYDDYKGKSGSRRFRFYNIFTVGNTPHDYAATDTFADYRKPRNYGCVQGKSVRLECVDEGCDYFERETHPCDRSKGLIWTVSSQREKDYRFVSQYLQTIKTNILNGDTIDFKIFHSIIYYFKDEQGSKEQQLLQFINDFHITKEEFRVIFGENLPEDYFKHTSQEHFPSKKDSRESINTSRSTYTSKPLRSTSTQQKLEKSPSSLSRKSLSPPKTFQFSPKYFNSQEAVYDENKLQQLETLLIDHKQVIFYGPPGTGKTYLAQLLAHRIAEHHYEIVQFHPSYAYEDFIEGIDALPSEEHTSVKHQATPRIFRKLCNYASAHPNENVVLIIDEINRGDLSRIFGELILGLEPSYRGKMEIRTPLSAKLGLLVIPPNLLIIGTMNSLDRSIAIVDYALRRRFLFYKLTPSNQILQKWQEQQDLSTQHSTDRESLRNMISSANFKPEMTFSSVICGIFERLNTKIRIDSHLGENYQIGHTYFFVTDIAQFNVNWEYKIFPILEEYLNFDSVKLQKYRLQTLLDDLYDPTY